MHNNSLTNTTNTGTNGNHVKSFEENNNHQIMHQKRPSISQAPNTILTTNSSTSSSSLKRSNDDHLSSAPNKIAKFVTEKSVS